MTQAKRGDIVRIHFTGRLENGAVLGSSENDEPIPLALGTAQMIPGLNRALVGMEVGEKKTVTVPMEEGFGPRRPELQQQVPKTALPENAKVGDQLSARLGDTPLTVWVRALDEDTAVDRANRATAATRNVPCQLRRSKPMLRRAKTTAPPRWLGELSGSEKPGMK